MEALVIESRRVKPNFAKRTHTYAKPEKVLDDAFFIAMNNELIAGKKPDEFGVTRKEVLDAVDSGRISPEVVADLEDALLYLLMEERTNEPSESMEDVMEFLRQR